MTDRLVSCSTITLLDEPGERSVERLAAMGFDAVELLGEPERYDVGAIREACARHDVTVSSICPFYSAELDFAAPDAAIRESARRRVADIVRFTADVGAPIMIASPTECLKTMPAAPAADERRWAVEALRELGELAGEHGVTLVIEPWNRYETYWVNRLDQAADLVAQIDLPSVAIMADVFHMAIEETDIAGAIRDHGPLVRHVHVTDSNRSAPGTAHLDLEPVLAALDEVGYAGCLAFEILPPAYDVFGPLRRGDADAFQGALLEQCRVWASEHGWGRHATGQPA
jgi:sugar phosphate isomerase/epimerase